MKINQIYQRTKLENGLKAVTHNMPDRNTVAVGIWIGVGGRYENKSKNGISHFLEHMVFKGSKKYSNRKIKESIEGVGGTLNAFTSEEFTCYLAKIPSKHLYLTLDILFDMAISPLLKEKDVTREKTVIMEEIKMYKDLPQHHVQELLDELLWPNHPLGMNIAGTMKSVGSISVHDLRMFRQRFYGPNNIVAAACGDIDHERFVTRIKKIYPRKTSDSQIGFKKVDRAKRIKKMHLYPRDTEQTHLSIGMRGLKRDHPDKYTLSLLNIILGANMSSRLFHEVREKRGLAYAIGSHVKRFYDSGAFLIQAGVDNKKAVRTIDVILEQLTKIKKEPVKTKELEYAKEYLTGQLLIDLEDTMDHMLWVGEQVKAMDKIYTMDQIIQGIKKITKRDLMKLANRIFKGSNISLALIGPNAHKDKKAIKKLLS